MTYDRALEAAIDDVGRDRVFALVRSYGWTDPPPKWVWSEAVRMLRERDKAIEARGGD